MSKGFYTYESKGSETVVTWVGPPGKSIGYPANSGPMGFGTGASSPATKPVRDNAKKRKKKGR